MVMDTSAIPSGGRLAVPLKMQSAMRSARRDLWLCSPSTQEMASTTFDFPQPFGPTIHVVPEPLKVTTVRSQNDLKPTISTFRSLSKVSSFSSHLAFHLDFHRAHPSSEPRVPKGVAGRVRCHPSHFFVHGGAARPRFPGCNRIQEIGS